MEAHLKALLNPLGHIFSCDDVQKVSILNPVMPRGASPSRGFTPRHCINSRLNFLQTEKYFQNLNKTNQNQIVFTIFKLIWNQTDVRLGSKSIGKWSIQSYFGLI